MSTRHQPRSAPREPRRFQSEERSASCSGAADAAAYAPSAQLALRRPRLRLLIERREMLARAVADNESHGLDSADAYALQLAVEDSIRDEDSRIYASHLGQWAEHDLRREHRPGDRPQDCHYCAPRQSPGAQQRTLAA